MIALSYLFLLTQLLLIIFIFYICIAFITGAPFVPTSNAAAISMITMAHLQKGDIVYDLGSGDGKLLALASKKGARVTGYEINPLLVLISNLRGTRTRWQNFWTADIHDADIIFIYLLPWKMERLAAKLKNECRKGTIIVSNSFIFPGWHIIRKDPIHHVYAFRI